MASTGRKSYFIGKVARYSLTLFIILTLNFLLPHLMPGDPVTNIFGDDARHAGQAFIDRLKEKYGLNKPLHEQYVDYLVRVATLDFGYSIEKRAEVADLLGKRVYWTTLLMLPAVVISTGLSVALGALMGFRRGSRFDKVMTTVALVVYSCPFFLLSMLAITLFSFHLDLFPLGNFTSGGKAGLAYAVDVAYHMALPAAVLAIVFSSYNLLVIRNLIVQISSEYHVFVAKSKGLRNWQIIGRHLLRNALPQILSLIALDLGFMISGALIVEVVFSLNGMGTLIYDAIRVGDYPVLQGAFLVIAISVLAANFLAEMLYGLADPRIGDSAGKQDR